MLFLGTGTLSARSSFAILMGNRDIYCFVLTFLALNSSPSWKQVQVWHRLCHYDYRSMRMMTTWNPTASLLGGRSHWEHRDIHIFFAFISAIHTNIKLWGGTDINLYLDPIILMVILFTGNGREDDIFVLLVPCFGFTKRFLDFSNCIFYTVSPWCIQKGLPNVILSLLVVYCILPTDVVSLASFCWESVDIFPKLWTEFSETLMKVNL